MANATSPVRWGILSTAKIGREKVVPGMLRSKELRIVAVASRDAARAAEFAAACVASRAYGSYEALLDDPEVEAVYNPLPNHLHVPLTLAAARAGKHVLCEKPIAITAAEAEALRDVPPGIHVAEAFMIRHHPQWQKAIEIVASGQIGELRVVQVAFSYFNADPANIRNRKDIGPAACSISAPDAILASASRRNSCRSSGSKRWGRRAASRSRSPSTPHPTRRRGSSSMTARAWAVAMPARSSSRRSISTSCRQKPSAGRSAASPPPSAASRMRS